MTYGLSEPLTGARGRRLEITGLIYLLVIALLVTLSIASYRHAFDDDVTVTVRAKSAGQQLNVGGDVRMNGAIVGRVSDVRTKGSGAQVDLQIDATAAERIPADVQARILPTTLFGQKFVELRSTSSTAAGHLVNGSSIAEDRSAEAIELTDVLDDLDAVLGAIQPDKLSAALNGLSGGLSGRGDDVHTLMVSGTPLLATLNDNSGRFERDLRLLRDVSGSYADAAPDFLDVLHDSAVTSRTFTKSQSSITKFVKQVSAASDTGDRLLRANADRLAEAAKISRPTLELLAEYSPELVCVIGGFLAVEASSAAQIRHNSFQGYFTVGQQTRGYTKDDALVLGDLGAGPHCRGLPKAPIPYPGVDLDDGVGDLRLIPLGAKQ
jgi:phospholipid/cholesterol/gamma-HCH transport system substrate-binding protein